MTASNTFVHGDRTVPESRTPGRRERSPLVPGVDGALLVAFGLLCGASAPATGFYDLSLWGWAAVAMLALLLVLLIVRPLPRGIAPALAVTGLLLLAGWSLASSGWVHFPGTALIEANRWMLYAATLSVLVLLVRSVRNAKLLLGATTAAILAVGIYLVIRMAAGDGVSLFLGGRLHKPIGYVNGQGDFLLLGFWPLMAVAERLHRSLWAPLALAAATLLGGLLVLTASRGVAAAFIASALVVVLVVPGRRVRMWALLAVLGAMLAVGGPLLHVYRSAGATAPSSDAIRRAAELTLVAAFCVGLLWWVVSAVTATLEKRAPAAGPARARLSGAVLIVLAVGALAFVAASAGAISHRVSTEYHAFTRLAETGRTARFFSGGGNRYDYWRIAVKEFRDQPLRGQGAGGYPVDYFRDRRTTEDILQPHSIELQTLAELGIVGAGALALFVGAVLFGLWHVARAGSRDPSHRALAVAAGGMFVAWLTHTSGDWLQRIPGVTGIALAAAAVLLVLPSRDAGGAPEPRRLRGRGALVLLALAYGVIVFAAVEVARPTLALHYRSQAQKALASNPTRALTKANQSLELNAEDIPTYYVKAAAYARFNRYDSARAALLEALRREPQRFVTWGLLGDLAFRRGDFREARRAYTRASELNPRDPTLARRVREARARAARAR